MSLQIRQRPSLSTACPVEPGTLWVFNWGVIREICAKKRNMKHKELTAKIIECAYKVHNTLGFGFLEAIYQNALLIELIKVGLRTEKEKKIQVYYDTQLVGDYMADIIVEDKVILELKSVKELHPAHEAQLINYLKATRLEVGLLINFGESVEIKRKILSHS